MFKKIILVPCLCYTFAVSGEISSHDIDESKKGVALGTFLTLDRAKKVVNKLPDFDIYIKQTTTTKRPYFVPFALNLKKSELKNKLKKIRSKIPSAYITSDSRVKQLSLDHLIFQNKKTEKIVKKEIPSNPKKTKITLLESDEEIPVNSKPKELNLNISKKMINRSNSDVDTTKKSITLGRFGSFDEALKESEKLKEYDILLKAPIISGNDFTIYAVNIEDEEYTYVFDELTKVYPSIEETSNTRLDFIRKRYINGDKFIKAVQVLDKKLINNDSSVFVLDLISKLQEDKQAGFNLKYNKAKALYDKGDYTKAVEAFEELYMDHNEHIPINFYLARSYYKLEMYEQASAAFERITILDENHQRARLELALTYMKLNFKEDAIKEFNIVLKDKTVPENVIKNIKQKIKEIEDKKKKHFFYGSVNLGVTFDNNADSRADIDTFTVQSPAEFELDNKDTINNDTIYTTGINANYLYKFNNSYSLENRFGYMHQFYGKDDQRVDDTNATGIAHESKKEFELASYNLYLTKYGKESLISGGLDLSKVKLGKKNYSQTYGATISYQSKMFKNTKNLAMLKYYRKDYTEEDDTGAKTSENLDSRNIQLILGNNIPTDKFGVFSILYSYLKEDRVHPTIYDTNTSKPSENTSDKDTNTLILSNTYPYSKNLAFNSSFMYSIAKNSKEDTTFLTKKKDRLLNLSLGASYKFNRDITISTEIKHTENKSNIEIYSYDKQTYGMNLKYFF